MSVSTYGRLWRWHFFAAFVVIPFVLWQSISGVLYLWSERWMDAAYPQLRFVAPQAHQVPLSEQIGAALASEPVQRREAGELVHRAEAGELAAAAAAQPESSAHVHGAHHGSPVGPSGLVVQRVLLPEERTRSTTVVLQRADGLPFPIFVDPYTGKVLGRLSGAAWLPGVTRALHGGWPLGEPGSWLLEIGDGWAIVMIATGLYLWWPRGRGLGALWPRVRSGPRVLLRDLHSCVAVWFSLVFLFFLISALPWTAFWGNKLLAAVESNTGQSSPAGFSPGGASLAQFAQVLQPLEKSVSAARDAGMRGELDVRLAPWPAAPLFITNVHVSPSQDRTLLADASDGRIRGDYRNEDLPAIPRFVALGIHVHQADFGVANVWLNTAFAGSLVWLAVTGVLSWWVRRPARKLGAPPKVDTRIPNLLVAGGVALCIVLPLLGASVLIIAVVDAAVQRSYATPP